MHTLHVCGYVAHARGPHLHNNWTRATRKSFLREILVLYQTAKFSPPKGFRYTVIAWVTTTCSTNSFHEGVLIRVVTIQGVFNKP